MTIMPLRFIMHEDASLVGKELADLATLKRLDFPIPDGIILFPPQIPFTTILRAYRDHDTNRFEQSLAIVRKQVFAIEPPEQLAKELKKHQLKETIVWKDALEKWLTQIRSKVWRFGVSEKLVEDLSPIPLFFTGKHEASGDAYFDPEEKSTKIRILAGNLSTEDQQQINQILDKLRKKVLAHYVLHWIADHKGIQIIRVVEYTHAISEQKYTTEIEVKKSDIETSIKPKIKTRLKLFADLSDGVSIDDDIDGIFLASERIETEDKKISKLVESCMLTDEYVIFQLTNKKSQTDVSSTLRLIHQPELVHKELQTFMFAKHNYTKPNPTLSKEKMPPRQPLLHLQLGIPKIVSINELQEIKKLMKKSGFERRGNTKLWVELSVPENWIHLQQYKDEGFDGVIVDLDDLYGSLIGVEQYETHPYYNFSAEVVLSFLEKFIKNIELPILFKSKHILDDEVIKFSIKNGISGLILNRIQLGGAREYIARFERKHLLERINNR